MIYAARKRQDTDHVSEITQFFCSFRVSAKNDCGYFPSKLAAAETDSFLVFHQLWQVAIKKLHVMGGAISKDMVNTVSCWG